MTYIKELSIKEFLEDYDWKEAFSICEGPYRVDLADDDVDLSPARQESVKEIIGLSNGEGDGESWIGLFLLHDGRYLFIDAWCDYTGWD